MCFRSTAQKDTFRFRASAAQTRSRQLQYRKRNSQQAFSPQLSPWLQVHHYNLFGDDWLSLEPFQRHLFGFVFVQCVILIFQLFNSFVVNLIQPGLVDVHLKNKRPTPSTSKACRDWSPASTSFWIAFIFQERNSSKRLRKFATQPSVPAM